ncbi:MAG: hypothetical protein AAGF71_05955 [Pseudomonadota bacterium]
MRSLSLTLAATGLLIMACTPETRGPDAARATNVSLAQTCAGAAAAGQLGGMTLEQCECFYTKADTILSQDLRDSLFRALSTGQSQSNVFENMSPTQAEQARAEMTTLAAEAPSCGIALPGA